jgi:hypothetical protein
MLRIATIVLVLAASLVATVAVAQEAAPSLDLLEPALTAPGAAVAPNAFAPGGELPALAPVAPLNGRALHLEARLTADGPAMTEGLVWRVFASEPDDAGYLQLIGEARGGSTTMMVAPGEYVVHVAFGRATRTERISVGVEDERVALALNAGGLRLDAVAGDGTGIDAGHLSFDVMTDGPEGTAEEEAGTMVIADAPPHTVLRLPAGTYHVVSRYGTVNSIVRADIEVTAGQLTEAVMHHDAAEVTLKLVSREHGEALANTSWTVLTAGGDTVHESVGAFPSIVLAAGAYTAVAIYGDDTYSRDFTVEPGVDREVDVRLSEDLDPPQALLPGESGGPLSP